MYIKKKKLNFLRLDW